MQKYFVPCLYMLILKNTKAFFGKYKKVIEDLYKAQNFCFDKNFDACWNFGILMKKFSAILASTLFNRMADPFKKNKCLILAFLWTQQNLMKVTLRYWKEKKKYNFSKIHLNQR